MHSAITRHHLLTLGLLGFLCTHTACFLFAPLENLEQDPDTEMAIKDDLPEPLDIGESDLDDSLDMDMNEVQSDLPELSDWSDMPMDMPDLLDITEMPDTFDMPDMMDIPNIVDNRYPVEVEAEDMTLLDYGIFNDNAASGGAWIQTQDTGTATMTFTGEPGLYRIIITYYDENDGKSSMIVSLEQKMIDRWDWDKDLGDNTATLDTRTTHTIQDVTIETGDLIEFQGISDAGERARFDVVLIEPM